MTYTVKDDGKVGVKNCCVRKDSSNCIEGSAVISYPDQNPLEARLNVTFFGRKFMSVFNLKFTVKQLNFAAPSPSNYWVLDSDYDHYSIVYLCDNLQPGQSKESFWLLSRTKVLSPDVYAKVESLIDEFFDRKDSVFFVDHQEE